MKISNPDFDQIGVIRSLEAPRKRYNRILPKGHFLGVNGPLFSQIFINEIGVQLSGKLMNEYRFICVSL